MGALSLLALVFAFSFFSTLLACVILERSKSRVMSIFSCFIDGSVFLALVVLRIVLKQEAMQSSILDWFAPLQFLLDERSWLFLILLQFLKTLSSCSETFFVKRGSTESDGWSFSSVFGRELTYLSASLLTLSGNEALFFTGLFLNAIGFYVGLSFGGVQSADFAAPALASRGMVQLICAAAISFVGYLLLGGDGHGSAALFIIGIGFFARSGLFGFAHFPDFFPAFRREALAQYFLILMLPAFLSGIFALKHGLFWDPSQSENDVLYLVLIFILFAFMLPALWGCLRAKSSKRFAVNLGALITGQVFIGLLLGQPLASLQMVLGLVFFIACHAVAENRFLPGFSKTMIAMQYSFMAGLPLGLFGTGQSLLFSEMISRTKTGGYGIWAILVCAVLLHLFEALSLLRALVLFVFLPAKGTRRDEDSTISGVSAGLLFLFTAASLTFFASGRALPWDLLPLNEWIAGLRSGLEQHKGLLFAGSGLEDSMEVILPGIALSCFGFLLAIFFLLLWKISSDEGANKMANRVEARLEHISSKYFSFLTFARLSWDWPALAFFLGPVRVLNFFETKILQPVLGQLGKFLLLSPRVMLKVLEGSFNDSRILRMTSGLGQKLSLLFSASDELSRGGQFLLLLSVLAVGLMFLGRM